MNNVHGHANQTHSGVSGLSLYLPEPQVKLQPWCDWTGNRWDKVSKVVGESFRLPAPHDNVYTMAANAALRLIRQYHIDPRRVGMLALGTESSTDNSAGAVIVRGMLDRALDELGLPRLSRSCEVPEFKHACLGGIYALKGALRYVLCDGGERVAIVVCGDIAEYERGSSGEATQGAGAVAIFSGRYSTYAYLDETAQAFSAMVERQGEGALALLEGAGGLFFHRPYAHMPVQALSLLWVRALAAATPSSAADTLAALCETAGTTVAALREELATTADLYAAVLDSGAANGEPADPYPLTTAVTSAARRAPAFKALVDAKCHLGRDSARQFGNLYTAALPAWLAAAFDDALTRDVELQGRPLYAIGYDRGQLPEVAAPSSDCFSIARVGKRHEAGFQDLGVEYYAFAAGARAS